MRLTPNQQKGAGIVLAGLVGLFTGHYLPPDVMGQIAGGVAGLF